MSGIITQCSKCKKWKLVVEFAKDKRRKNGISSWCKKCCRERKNEYYKENLDAYREINRKSRNKNIDKIREKEKNYRKNNLDKFREKDHKWYVENSDKKNKYNKLWFKKNPDKKREYNNTRRYRENSGIITEEEWKKLCEKYKNSCLCCGRSDVKMTLDHVIPLKLGGKNVIENAQPLCKSCNCKKNARHIDYR